MTLISNGNSLLVLGVFLDIEGAFDNMSFEVTNIAQLQFLGGL